MELNETIIVKIEVPTSSCVGCFYHIEGEPCSRHTEMYQEGYIQPDCSEGDGADAKYWIFKPQTK